MRGEMTKHEVFSLGRLATPLGEMLVVTDERERLRAADFWEYESRMNRLLRLHYRDGCVTLRSGHAPTELRARMEDYFAGGLSAIDDIEVLTAGTDFQREVWSALRSIPAGEVRSYGELAGILERPRAVRAVGLANGANPINVVVPCHRVIGSNKSLTGYGGGLERKRWLLQHEGALRHVAEKERGATG
jgi:methylated-DNA-[protein]-cysteine S-methyltransferase